MALDLCIEAAGGLIHAFDAVWLDRRLPGFGSFRGGSEPVEPVPAIGLRDADVDRRVTCSLDELPITEARMVWLIDVCGLTYAEAAAEAGTGRDEVAATIASARRRIRNELARLPDWV